LEKRPRRQNAWRRPGISVERVRRYLERRIIEGDLKPRERIIEQEVCEQVGLSRSPVREALRQLASEGLVEFNPRRGARVADITASEVLEVFQIFEELETLSTRLAARRITREHLGRLRKLLPEMREAVASNDVRAYWGLNAQFHDTLYEASGNGKLRLLLANLGKQITRFRIAALATPGRMAASLAEHRTLVKALRSGDEAAATGLARTSVAHACRALTDRLRLGEPLREEETWETSPVGSRSSRGRAAGSAKGSLSHSPKPVRP
jgi:DNA-binding GntR family transcriptional regulator